MAINVKGIYTIKPKEPTWEGILPLSEWDQTGRITHVPTVTFYNKPVLHFLTPKNSIIETLKDSLSRVLVHFYSLAGRIRWVGQGRLELLCNGMGTQLVEAESNIHLTDFEDFASHTREFEGLVPTVDYGKPIDELPLMLAQLTVFSCGGISLGITICHAVVDGQCAFHFMNEWARLSRGEPLQLTPYISYNLLEGRKQPTSRVHHAEMGPPPLLIGREGYMEERIKPTAVSILPLTKEQVDSLKTEANRVKRDRPYSRYEVVTAHVWRSTCKARGHLHEQPTGLGFPVNVRTRLNPPLPQTYFGNAIIDVVALATAGEVMTKPLSYTCGKIREAIEKVNDEYVWANIEFLKSFPDFTTLQDLKRDQEVGPFYGNPNLGVISWLNFPIYGLDFGWGKEIYMGPGAHNSDGDCLVIPGPVNDGSLKIALCFQVAHIDDFKKYFYQDISLN